MYVYVHAFSDPKIELAMERFCIDSCVRGYHVYSDIWSASVGEELPCEREDGNSADPFAVAIFWAAVTDFTSLLTSARTLGAIVPDRGPLESRTSSAGRQ